ncbi:hypothetical protein GQ607_008626, partial [Colletotrichum asianum]
QTEREREPLVLLLLFCISITTLHPDLSSTAVPFLAPQLNSRNRSGVHALLPLVPCFLCLSRDAALHCAASYRRIYTQMTSTLQSYGHVVDHVDCRQATDAAQSMASLISTEHAKAFDVAEAKGRAASLDAGCGRRHAFSSTSSGWIGWVEPYYLLPYPTDYPAL